MLLIGLKPSPEELRDHNIVAQKHCLGMIFSHSSPSMVTEQWLYMAGNFMMRVSNFEQSAETFFNRLFTVWSFESESELDVQSSVWSDITK